jgi:hypothetical protein
MEKLKYEKLNMLKDYEIHDNDNEKDNYDCITGNTNNHAQSFIPSTLNLNDEKDEVPLIHRSSSINIGCMLSSLKSCKPHPILEHSESKNESLEFHKFTPSLLFKHFVSSLLERSVELFLFFDVFFFLEMLIRDYQLPKLWFIHIFVIVGNCLFFILLYFFFFFL